MKNKKKLIVALVLFVCSFTCLGWTVQIALADKIFIESEKKVYYGEELNAENISLYEQCDITLSECSWKTPLIEFVINPSHTGTAESYTPDFEKLDIRLFDPTNPEKNLAISLVPHYTLNNNVIGAVDEYFISILAAGGTQSLGAEWVGAQEKNDGVLATKWSGYIVQTFDGFTRYGNYIDENGNYISAGENRAIRIFYDVAENALYTDVGEAGENRQCSFEDNGVIKYRWRIRDFDKSDYKDMWGGTVSTVWQGFGQDEKLKLGINFDNIVEGKEPSILVSKIAGKALMESPIVVETPSKGQTNLAYPIPEPIYYDEKTYSENTFVSVGGEYEITKKTDSGYILIQEYRTFGKGDSFTPDSAGDYVITYRALNQTSAITIRVEDDLAKTRILPNILPTSCYINDTLNLGAACESPSMTNKPQVSLEIFKDGNFIDKWKVEESLPVTFEEDGQYALIYSSTDYLGRLTREERTLDVRRYYVSWTSGISERIAFPVGSSVVAPSVADVLIFDILFNKNVDLLECIVSVSYNGGEYKSVESEDFLKQGEYIVKYQIKYDAYGEESLEIYRRIFIYNEALDEIEVKGLPLGTKLAEQIFDPVVISLKAVKDKRIVIPYNYFGRQMTSVMLVEPEGKSTDITQALTTGDFMFEPHENGIYEITATDENDFYHVVKLLKIDVREKWVSFYEMNELKLPLGANVFDFLPVCKDFYGNLVSEYKTELFYMGEKVEIGSGKLEKLGIYEVVYTYENDGEVAQGNRIITTFDATAPILKLQQAKISARLNQTVRLAKYETSDDSTLRPKITVTVTHDGEAVNIFNNAFQATKKGIYVVTYYAVDAQGNSVTAQYEVNVKGYSDVIVSSTLGAVILAAGIVSAVIVLKKNKNKKGENRYEKN